MPDGKLNKIFHEINIYKMIIMMASDHGLKPDFFWNTFQLGGLNG